ncbi:DUF4124 domain-containing protein [Thalassotalea sp. Y01]|uniref:DUF4124 domain-containing protein n=1 Tax=Thalassotalea sp. Y01 TaxID=2729613 RepID=UPI00145C3AE1|nr:DUF4124 domain-containing protein [Thalassotalea sp. Y01]NMP17256.1 DUF4124 domain-containing protein [Thalassotalea sp. Y01]
MTSALINISALLALTISVTAFAQDVTVYRWVDENGVIHYGQHEPIKEDYEEVKVATSYSPVKSPMKEVKKEGEEQTPDLAQASSINCKNAQANLRTLTEFDKVEMTDADGRSRLLTDKERLDRIALSEKEVEIYCQ